MSTTFVAMMIGSRKSTLPLVKQSIETIYKNLGGPVKVLIGLAPWISPDIVKYVHTMFDDCEREPKIPPTILDNCKLTFAGFVNHALDMAYSQGYTWFIESHDDVQILTPNLVGKVESLLLNDRNMGKSDKIGWISFLDKDYLNAQWAPSVREGFALDAIKENAWSRKKTHQFHTLPEGWWSFGNTRSYLESLPYDIPAAPVICHAPFSHFIMANTRTLYERIGKCEDWSPVSLLIDEDRGLKAMSVGLYNLWLPMIEYVHCRSGGTRAHDQIREYGPTVHAAFKAKWGFEHKAVYSDAELDVISKRYAGTNVCWSVGRRTYDWQYW